MLNEIGFFGLKTVELSRGLAKGMQWWIQTMEVKKIDIINQNSFSFSFPSLFDFTSNAANGHNLDLSIGGIFNYHLTNSPQKLNIERPKVIVLLLILFFTSIELKNLE